MADAALTQQKDAVEYGQQGKIDAQAAAMPAGVPPVDPVAIAQAAVAPEVPVAPAAQQAAPEQQGYTIKNPYMLLPSKMLYGDITGQRATPVEQQYEAGLLWRALANSPTADPITKQIAKRLAGGE